MSTFERTDMWLDELNDVVGEHFDYDYIHYYVGHSLEALAETSEFKLIKETAPQGVDVETETEIEYLKLLRKAVNDKLTQLCQESHIRVVTGGN